MQVMARWKERERNRSGGTRKWLPVTGGIWA